MTEGTKSEDSDPSPSVQEGRHWWNWIPTSMNALEVAEQQLLKAVKCAVKGFFVPIRFRQSRLWTLKVGTDGERIPLVLVHGFGGGVGLWAQNFDALAVNRTIYAFDLLGFGRSSRPKFSTDPTLAEMEWVQSLEDWRRHMQLDQFLLLGHSLGGFLASSYALEYPDRVRHLILVDPWGFPTRPLDADRQVSLPTWVRAVARIVTVFNPLSTLRAAGPWGRSLVKRIRPDLGARFAADPEDAEAIFDYIYHCNVQHPSGETAFKCLTVPFGWAKRPMVDRLSSLRRDIPITFIYGGRSWIDSGPGYEMQHELRRNSYVHVEVIRGAGHHVYADRPGDFNEAVGEVCRLVDTNKDTL